MAKQEVWKDIPTAPWHGLYQISSHGRVRHAPRLIAIIVRNGYDTVTFSYNNKKITVGVHRLLAAAFLRNPKAGEVIHHKNGKKRDNNLTNLEWTTRGENSSYPRHPNAKIDPMIAFEMRLSGYSHREIGERFNVTQSATSAFFARAIHRGQFKPDINPNADPHLPPKRDISPNAWCKHEHGRSMCLACGRYSRSAPRQCPERRHHESYARMRDGQEKVRAERRAALTKKFPGVGIG